MRVPPGLRPLHQGLNYAHDVAMLDARPPPADQASVARGRWASAARQVVEGGSSDAPLLRSRHAIMCDGMNGRIYAKGERERYLALPHPRTLCRGAKRGPLLCTGSRLNLIIDMAAREMHIELIGEGSALTPDSRVEIGGLSHEVAVVLCLGPSESETRVRLVGCSIDPPERLDLGKAVKGIRMGARRTSQSIPSCRLSLRLPCSTGLSTPTAPLLVLGRSVGRGQRDPPSQDASTAHRQCESRRQRRIAIRRSSRTRADACMHGGGDTRLLLT